MGESVDVTVAVESGSEASSPDAVVVASLRAGDQVGRYRIERVLGHGGMGVVYCAFDPELDRRLALKVMRPETAIDDAQLRLLREAKALAGLSHVNVVTVYDVGLVDGRPYVAMELVEGPSLRAWLSEGPHAWPRVLEVMLAAGRGLAAAHACGIVHRDFKPANVLLGSDGRARVVDFGLALGGAAESESGVLVSSDRRSGSRSSRHERLTEVGIVVGTPAYMAPEQAAGETVDARSDQFSFCVALHEALYGELPFAGENRRARTRNARLGRIRDAPPGSLVHLAVRSIVVRGLAPDPEHRWPDLDALLHALERASSGRRRIRMLVAAASVLSVGVGVAAIVLTRDACASSAAAIDAVWNADARTHVAEAFEATQVSYADDAWARASERVDAFARAWSDARARACRTDEIDPHARDLRLSCLGRRRAELVALLDVFRHADAEVVQRAVHSANKLGGIAECEEASGLPPPPAIAARVEEVRDELASIPIYSESRRYRRALEVGDVALRTATELDYPPLLAEALLRHGDTEEEAGEYAAAGEHLEQAFHLANESGLDELAAKAALELLFMYGYRQGDATAAETWRGHAEAAAARLGAAGATSHARLAETLGVIALRQGDFVAARDLLLDAVRRHSELVGDDDLHVASVTGNLGVVYLELGERDEAREAFESARDLTASLLGPEHPDVASWHNNLGALEQSVGNHEASLAEFRTAYEIEAPIFGEVHPNVAMSLNNIGGALSYLGRDAEATDYFARSIATYEAIDGADPIDLARPMGNLGRTLSNLGEHERGAEQLRRAIRIIEDSSGPDHPELAVVCLNLGNAYLQLGRTEEAVASMQRALEIDRKTLGRDHALVGISLATLGDAYLDLGRRGEAVAALEEAVRLQSAGEGDPEHLAASKFSLARALWSDETARARARDLAREAETIFASAAVVADDRLQALHAWRASVEGD